MYYKTGNSILPDYIKSIFSPKRSKHVDSLIKLPSEVKNLVKNICSSNAQGGPTTYNAWDEDIATLNVFFGQDTVMGENFHDAIITYICFLHERA